MKYPTPEELAATLPLDAIVNWNVGPGNVASVRSRNHGDIPMPWPLAVHFAASIFAFNHPKRKYAEDADLRAIIKELKESVRDG